MGECDAFFKAPHVQPYSTYEAPKCTVITLILHFIFNHGLGMYEIDRKQTSHRHLKFCVAEIKICALKTMIFSNQYTVWLNVIEFLLTVLVYAFIYMFPYRTFNEGVLSPLRL